MTATTQEIKEIPVHHIQTDGTQSRAAMSQETIDEYAEQIGKDVKFPPLVVFFDGERFWLGDGFHRLEAAKKAGCNHRWCEVHEGTQRDALQYSLQANITHGLRRTNADKRHAVELVLADDEWHEYSNHIIAEMCGVSHPFVATVRDELGGSELVTVTSSHTETDSATANRFQLKPTKRLGRDGKMRPATNPKPQPSPDEDDPAADISFNPIELEAEIAAEAESLAKVRAEGEKKIKSGTEIMVPIPLIKKAERAFGGLVRAIHDLGRHPFCKVNKYDLGCDAELNSILEAILSVNGPVEIVDGGWAIKDDDDDGLAARTIWKVMHATAVRSTPVASAEEDDAAADAAA